MAEHFCVEHQTKWFKTGNMKSFAHPIKDEDGDTVGWCNEPKKEKEPEKKATAPIPNGKEGARSVMSPEDWAKKDRIERASYEAQTAFKGIIELGKAIITTEGKEFPSNLDKVYQEALDWASAHLKVGATPAPAEKKAEPKVEGQVSEQVESPEGGFKNVGDLFTKAKSYGISSQDVMSAVDVKKPEEIINLDEAWEATAKKFASTIKAQQEAV